MSKIKKSETPESETPDLVIGSKLWSGKNINDNEVTLVVHDTEKPKSQKELKILLKLKKGTLVSVKEIAHKDGEIVLSGTYMIYPNSITGKTCEYDNHEYRLITIPIQTNLNRTIKGSKSYAQTRIRKIHPKDKSKFFDAEAKRRAEYILKQDRLHSEHIIDMCLTWCNNRKNN